jgi:Ca-activated chloride channel family protein
MAWMETPQPPKPALPLLVLLALASALGVGVAVALAGIAMLLAAPAYAGGGSLLLQRSAALADEAPLLFAETETEENGPIARTRIVQAFHNPFAERVQAIYLNRLPADALLQRFSLTVLGEESGEEPVAAADLRLAVLSSGAVLAERTAEVGAGETVLVELEYLQVLRYDLPRRGLRLLSSR